jgi:micrococcal nuclease
MKRGHFILVLNVIIILISIGCNLDRQDNSKASVFYTVIKITDGDTFWADDGSEKGIKIRLIGVDAPETRRTRNKEVGYYGQESKAYLAELIGGEKVRLEFDVDPTDRYGRSLAYVYKEDGTFVNAELVKNGFAMVMTVPPNVKYAEMLLALQQHARENNIGLWQQQ